MADKEYLKTLIRRALIRDPSISVRALSDMLGIDKNTAWKYRKEVVEENRELLEEEIKRLQKTTLEEEIAKWEIEFSELIRELWRIISSGKTSRRDKISAIRALVNAKRQMFDIKFDAGLFVRKLGEGTLNIPLEGILDNPEALKTVLKTYKKLANAEKKNLPKNKSS